MDKNKGLKKKTNPNQITQEFELSTFNPRNMQHQIPKGDLQRIMSEESFISARRSEPFPVDPCCSKSLVEGVPPSYSTATLSVNKQLRAKKQDLRFLSSSNDSLSDQEISKAPVTKIVDNKRIDVDSRRFMRPGPLDPKWSPGRSCLFEKIPNVTVASIEDPDVNTDRDTAIEHQPISRNIVSKILHFTIGIIFLVAVVFISFSFYWQK